MKRFTFRGYEGREVLFYVDAETEEEARKILNGQFPRYDQRQYVVEYKDPKSKPAPLPNAELIHTEKYALLPCPFCQGRAHIQEREHMWDDSWPTRYFVVGCDTKGCFCYDYIDEEFSTYEEAATKWNNRVIKENKNEE